MTLNQLNYFIAAARCLSFTEAAKSLFITQPALSRQIQAMEEELGTPLFVRDHKTLKLTPGGSVLFRDLPELMDGYNDLMGRVRTANLGFEGRLALGILEVYDIDPLLPGVVAEFQRRYPHVQLSLSRSPLGLLPQQLYQGEVDLALTYGFSLFEQPELMTVNVQKFNSCILLPRNHPLADKPDLSLTDLAQERFIQLSPQVSQEGDKFLRQLFARYGIQPHIIPVKSMGDVLTWVELGHGVALTTNRTTEHHHPKMVVRPLNEPEAFGHDIAIGWHKTNYNPAIALFMELLERELKQP